MQTIEHTTEQHAAMRRSLEVIEQKLESIGLSLGSCQAVVDDIREDASGHYADASDQDTAQAARIIMRRCKNLNRMIRQMQKPLDVDPM